MKQVIPQNCLKSLGKKIIVVKYFRKYLLYKIFILNIIVLKVHQCKFENLTTSSSSYENNMLKIAHLNTF